MKISFIAILVFSLSIGISNAEVYQNANFDFSIEYPEDWFYDDELFLSGGIVFIVSFYDNLEGYYSSLDVELIEDDVASKLGTDKQQLERLNKIYEGYCASYSFEVEGYVCEDLIIDYSRVLNLNGYTAYEIKQFWYEVYPDEGYFENVDIIRMIPGNSGAWFLYSQTQLDSFDEYEEEIYEMLDSFSLPESEITLKTPDILMESGKYVNERFGFSIFPPAGWLVGVENQEVNNLVFPISFHNNEFEGLFSPSITMYYLETDPIDFSMWSEQEFLDSFKKGFLESIERNGMKANIVFENYETFDTFSKVTLRIEGNIVTEGVPYFVKYEVIGWGFEDGKFYTVFYLADFEDFDKNFPTFRKSLNTLEIFDKEVDTSIEIIPRIPDWVRNNAKWWSEELISDSDFIVGIKYLIETGSIDVQTSTYSESGQETIPQWIKTNAGWWAAKQISDGDFLKGIQFLVEQGLIQLERPEFEGKDNL